MLPLPVDVVWMAAAIHLFRGANLIKMHFPMWLGNANLLALRRVRMSQEVLGDVPAFVIKVLVMPSISLLFVMISLGKQVFGDPVIPGSVLLPRRIQKLSRRLAVLSGAIERDSAPSFMASLRAVDLRPVLVFAVAQALRVIHSARSPVMVLAVFFQSSHDGRLLLSSKSVNLPLDVEGFQWLGSRMFVYTCDACAKTHEKFIPPSWFVVTAGPEKFHVCSQGCLEALKNSKKAPRAMRIEPQKSTKKISTTIYLEDEQRDALRRLSKTTRVPSAHFIREGVDLILRKHGLQR